MNRNFKACGWIWAVVVGMASAALAQQPQGEEQAGMEDFMKAMGTMLSGATNSASAVVDFRELKALLPAELPGMKRTKASGEKSATMGMTVAFAEGTYEAEDNGYVELKISDMGGMGGLMAFAQAGWAMTEIDRETDTGFERTTTYNGSKAQEEYDNTGKSGSIKIMVGKRFMVEITGNQVAFDTLKAAAEKIDLKKLEGLKPAAPTPAAQ